MNMHACIHMRAVHKEFHFLSSPEDDNLFNYTFLNTVSLDYQVHKVEKEYALIRCILRALDSLVLIIFEYNTWQGTHFIGSSRSFRVLSTYQFHDSFPL